MSHKKKHRLIYCGQDALTLETLLKSKICSVIGVADVEQFTSAPAKNLADKLFKFTYLLKKKESFFTFYCLCLYSLIGKLSSYSFRNCFRLLKLICQKELKIIQVSDFQRMRHFCEDNLIDLLVVNNWWLLPEAILDLPKYGTLNVHPSKLPHYRGSLPTLWSLKNNDRHSALSFIKLAKGMDNGNIIEQIDFAISQTDDAITLEHKIEELLEKNMESVIHNYITTGHTTEQDADKATFTANYHPYMKVDWQKEKARNIVNKINLYPYLWPFDFCYSEINCKKIFYKNASLLKEPPKNILLTTVGDATYSNTTGYIKTHDGYVKVSLLISMQRNLP